MVKMEIIDYSEKSFVLIGEDTKIYKEQLKKLNGKFSKVLDKEICKDGIGWIFSKKNRERVDKFLADLSTQKSDTLLPTVITVTETESKVQIVKWKVPRPKVGQKVNVSVNSTSLEGTIAEIETHNDIIDTFYIDTQEGKSKVVIINGKWQIFGLSNPHFVKFTN